MKGRKERSTTESVLAIVLCLIIAPFFPGCVGYLPTTPVSPAPVSPAPVSPAPDPNVLIDQHLASAVKQIAASMHGTNDGYCNYIEGNVTNNTGSTISYAEIDFNIFNADMQQIGSEMDNCLNLEPGTTWHFKVFVSEDGFKKFRLSDLVGWNQ